VVEIHAEKEEVVDAEAIQDPRVVGDVVIFVVDDREVLVDGVAVAVVVVELGSELGRGVGLALRRGDATGRRIAVTADNEKKQNKYD
jgi:hypothetical protein